MQHGLPLGLQLIGQTLGKKARCLNTAQVLEDAAAGFVAKPAQMVVKPAHRDRYNEVEHETGNLWLILPATVALAACDSSVPDDTGAGVGFGDYATYQQQQRLAQQQAQQRAQATVVLPPEPETVVPPSSTASTSTGTSTGNADLASLASAAIDAAEAPATPLPPAAPPSNSTAISDEQDFDAVASRETIETDAERLARMADQRVEVAPTAVPDRPGSTGPNIVEYALSTSHPIGQQVYRRSGLRAGRHEENCLSYQSADLAQQAFLALGGPERDRQALDPDGDGYACNWDPNIYRNAARGG